LLPPDNSTITSDDLKNLLKDKKISNFERYLALTFNSENAIYNVKNKIAILRNPE
jgi:hypothetical protein